MRFAKREKLSLMSQIALMLGLSCPCDALLFAGGVVFEMVVTQAGGQGNGVQVPDAFRVHAVFGFLLFVAVIQAENLQPRAFVGRLGGFVAVVDAVFHHVSVAEGAGEVQIRAGRFDFA